MLGRRLNLHDRCPWALLALSRVFPPRDSREALSAAPGSFRAALSFTSGILVMVVVVVFPSLPARPLWLAGRHGVRVG